LPLIRRLPLLEAQRRLRLAHLRRQALHVLGVVRGVGPQLVGPDDGEQLPLADGVPFTHLQLRDLPRHLRTDQHVVGGDDTGQDQHGRAAVGVDVRGGETEDDDEEDEQRAKATHTVELKRLYQTDV
jgi:hypothetical protein